MNSAENRLETFIKANLHHKLLYYIIPYLANNGFYMENCFLIRCHYCSLIIMEETGFNDLLDYEVTRTLHLRYNPYCPLKNNIKTDNIPIPTIVNHSILTEKFNIHKNMMTYKHYNLKNDNKQLNAGSFPCYEYYSNMELRMKSFNKWPKVLNALSMIMAHAGFFYTSHGDEVICFQCGVLIKDWEIDADPWFIHYQNYAHCYNLLLHKGMYFKDKFFQNNTPTMIDNNTIQHYCKLCRNKICNMALIPCGHIATCDQCYFKFHNCPICMQQCSSFLPIYFK